MNAESELERLLAAWGAQHRLSDAQAAEVRLNIVGEPRQTLDAEWLWSLLRPVTDLLLPAEERAEARPWLRDVPDNWTPYLQLA